MHPLHTQRILIVGALVLGVFAVVGWQVYNGGSSVLSARAQTTVMTYEEQIRKIDIATQRFQAVQLDVAFLSSPEFRSLKDYSVVIPRPAVVGRENPFEPLPEAVGGEQLPTRDQTTLDTIIETPEALPPVLDFDSNVFNF